MSNPPEPPQENIQSSEPPEPKAELPTKIFEILSTVPEPERERIIAGLKEEFQVVQEISMRHYSGPIPHPDILRGIEDIAPGSAAKVIQMALDQGKHRQEMERHVVRCQTNQSSTGQWLGFTIAMFGIIASVYLIATGHDVAGSVLGGIDLISLVSIFVLGKVAQNKDLEERKDS